MTARSVMATDAANLIDDPTGLSETIQIGAADVIALVVIGFDDAGGQPLAPHVWIKDADVPASRATPWTVRGGTYWVAGYHPHDHGITECILQLESP